VVTADFNIPVPLQEEHFLDIYLFRMRILDKNESFGANPKDG